MTARLGDLAPDFEAQTTGWTDPIPPDSTNGSATVGRCCSQFRRTTPPYAPQVNARLGEDVTNAISATDDEARRAYPNADHTSMLFGDAKKSVSEVSQELKVF
jgi:hypothetical protein